MSGRFSMWIGIRYTGARQQNHFISFISLVSLLGLILGVVVLVTIVSVMNGFDRALRYSILEVIPHGVIQSSDHSIDLDNWLQLAATIEGQQQVQGTAPFIETQGMLTQRGSVNVVALYGILPEREGHVSIIPAHIERGSLADLREGRDGIVLGRELAYSLGVGVGDELTLIVPQPSKAGGSVLPKMVKVTLVATFRVGAELDYTLALMHVADIAGILMLEREVHGIRVQVDDLFTAPHIIRQTVAALGPDRYEGVDWTATYGDLFQTIGMEKTMMFLLLLLIVAIAAFNIVSGLIMLVDDKKADIAMLRTLGVSPATIMGIYVVQGSVIGIVGTLLGMVLGIVLAINITEIVAWFEQLLNLRVLGGTYFDSVPSDLRLTDLLLIFIVTIVISFVSTLYPAYRAAQLNPSEVLRTE
ncbi:MAG: lipoprotein-releasing ABC transporter permease subunit [Pseudomonadales bacterium]|nr:lipoprotein-releasing ABC transporter permease subunit [Pseudomonadales bacterium]MDP7358409.1 lipoprotein-releasing ABC transporter permease subunit [Pseudomonadales bacterium]MDP7594022.1 lipoprotein-releasing ABC transporter permease subunit [Pseudomonadales bacterium]HJN53341.1 lipoprotein-releasing ABC transporter permease subunit [Pseudomonadales bacterium]